MEEKVKGELRDFVLESFLFGDSSRLPADSASLISERVIDSTGVLELIGFLESHFGIEVTESETVPENLESLDNLTRFVLHKLEAVPTAGQAAE